MDHVGKRRECFVIMPISSAKHGARRVPAQHWKYLFDKVITPTVREFGFEAIRADTLNKTGSIIRDIVEHIVSAELAIVDLTNLNANVLYELGVRHSLSNRTILLTQDLRQLPFDLRDLRVVEYSLVADGPEQLRRRLSELIEQVDAAPDDDADNPVLQYLTASRRDLLSSRIVRAATYQSYLTPPEERIRQEEQQASALAERLSTQWANVEAGEVLLGLRDYEIAEIATLFNVSGKSSHQRPRRKEMLAVSFAIARYPVTNAEYRLFIADTGHTPPEHWRNGWYHPFSARHHPVTDISFRDAESYCHWLSRKTGYLARLPREDEWEMAARGAADLVYPWGDTISSDNCNCELAGRHATTPIFAYDSYASPHGVVDMAGNTWEWVIAGEPSLTDYYAALKGGSFESNIFEVKIGYRELFRKDYGHSTIGFRVVRVHQPLS